MKRLKMILFLISFFSLFGCDQEFGNLKIELKAEKFEIKSGETLKFDLQVPEEETFVSARYTIINPLAEQLEHKEIDTPSFEYTFTTAGTYTVDTLCETEKDYGVSKITVTVSADIVIPDWDLGISSIEGGEGKSITIDISGFPETIASTDLRILKSGQNRAAIIKKEIQATEEIDISELKFGSYIIKLFIYDKYGNGEIISDDFTILDPNNPIFIEFYASKGDENYENTIFVAGSIDAQKDITDVYMERTCYYGKDPQVSPLAEPKHNGGIDYLDESSKIIAYTERYSALDPKSPLKYNFSDNTFTFIDPMPYYGKNGNIEETNFKWDYAKIDREAWKYIKRHKEFDMKKAFEVEYKISARTSYSPEYTESLVKKGHPYLGKREMTSLCIWLKQVAMNRAWRMQVPRYCYGKSRDWLGGMTINSVDDPNIQGEIIMEAGSSGGSVDIKNYSDWEGISISSIGKISMTVNIFSNNNRQELSFAFDIKTPLYNGECHINNMGVRDYMLQWGMWADSRDGGPCGTITLKRKNEAGEIIKEESLSTGEMLDLYPNYTNTPYFIGFGNGYDESDYEGITHHGEPPAQPSSWTKINFLYPPTGKPEGTNQGVTDTENGNWAHREDNDRVMVYEYY
ncbi:MAG: hypothetical protein JXR63_11755 [Spirochaetales bacterium]|nr:hypothetical protein [Spirochaetales bacterium]